MLDVLEFAYDKVLILDHVIKMEYCRLINRVMFIGSKNGGFEPYVGGDILVKIVS